MADDFVLVPAREARAVRVPPGGRFRVVDLEGGQVVDLFAFAAGDVGEYASAEHTRIWVNRLFPRVGEVFVTNRRRPILSFERDDSPGVHDMLCAACDPTRYRLLGVAGWHASCQENLQRAMAALGHDRVEVPQPINLFMAVRVEPDGSLAWARRRPRPVTAWCCGPSWTPSWWRRRARRTATRSTTTGQRPSASSSSSRRRPPSP
jgi:uncharacterized protein YcgI (DUF1989 family)